MSRLTDDELREALAHAQSLQSLRLTAVVSELIERRAADPVTVAIHGCDDGTISRVYLTGREVEALRWLREWVVPHLDLGMDNDNSCEHCINGMTSLAVLDRLPRPPADERRGEVMGGRDHSVECEDCGHMRGGMNDLLCDCDQHGLTDTLEAWQRLESLAANLAIAGALCEAYGQGWDACIEAGDSLAAYEGDLQTQDEHDARLARLWSPGHNLSPARAGES